MILIRMESIKYHKMRDLKSVAGLWVLLICVNGAKRMIPPELSEIPFKDQTQKVRLAQDEQFLMPLSGRTISYDIQYVPENRQECTFTPQQVEYQMMADSPPIFEDDSRIVAVLPLLKKEIVLVADPYYKIASYSIDEHFMMQPQIPSTTITNSPKIDSKVNPLQPFMFATSDEQHVYYLTQNRSFVFSYNSLSQMEEFRLDGQPMFIVRVVQYRNFVMVGTGKGEIFIYTMEMERNSLKLSKKVTENSMQSLVDMEFDEEKELLYALDYVDTIFVFQLVDNEGNLVLYDSIPLTNITKNHQALIKDEFIGNLKIRISSTDISQNIMILFNHNYRTVVAEITYFAEKKEYMFIRYYKYAVQIKDMIMIKDIMMVLADDVVGMFPYAVDPRLIEHEFNGYMALAWISSITAVKENRFIGVKGSKIEYAGLSLNNQAGLECHIGATSKLKSVHFRANLTACDEESPTRLGSYCAYEKTFLIESMEITTSAPIANSIWILSIVFTLLIVAGLCCVFVMHKKKQNEIKKLELYFEERKQKEVPASSDRA